VADVWPVLGYCHLNYLVFLVAWEERHLID
jgi:hypothetical protein